MRASYTVRLILAFAAVGAAGALITALVVNVAFGDLLGGYLNAQQQARQDQIVSLLANSYSKYGSWNTSDLDALVPSMAMSGAAVTVQDAGGGTVWESSKSPGQNMMGGMMRQGIMGGSLGPAQRVPIVVAGNTVGTAVIRMPLAGNAPTNVAFRNSVNAVLVLSGLASAVVAIGLGLWLARRATVPVRELTRGAQELAAGVRGVHVDYRSDDEFGAMAMAFNSMAESITEEDRLRRTFAADVAHELRTPLMIVNSQLEAMEDGVMELGPDAISSLLEETQRMTRMVSDLEVMATADAAHFSLERSRVDLSDEVAAALQKFRPLFEQRSVRLEVSLHPAVVDGDVARLRQVAANLLSNALKFTPDAGQVRVSVTAAAANAVLQVADSGKGIPEDEIGHVFERFFRGRNVRASGSGIGLAVVQELVSAHGGRITVANGADGGAVFTVTLPLAQAQPVTGAVARAEAAVAS